MKLTSQVKLRDNHAGVILSVSFKISEEPQLGLPDFRRRSFERRHDTHQLAQELDVCGELHVRDAQLHGLVVKVLSQNY